MAHDDSPADVVRAVIAALADRGFDDVAQYVDPVQLRRQYEATLEIVRNELPPRVMTAEDFLRQDADMPRVVAEYYAHRTARHAEEGPHTLRRLELQTLEDLEALTPAQYLGTKLRVEDPWFSFEQHHPAQAAHAAELFGDRPLQRREVVGEVVEGDTAYVLYRADWGRDAGEVSLAVLRRSEDGWRLLPRGPLFGEGPSYTIGWAEMAPPPAGPLAVRQAPWISRTFEHRLAVELLPGVLERFRSAPARASEIALSVVANVRTARPAGGWSIHEHVGHLLDLEALGEQRLEDYRRRAEVLSAADMSNRATHEAGHHDTPIWELTERFADARRRLADALAALPLGVLAHRALHPRLQRDMNVPEWVFFMCEHDDHHLARMREQALDLAATSG